MSACHCFIAAFPSPFLVPPRNVFSLCEMFFIGRSFDYIWIHFQNAHEMHSCSGFNIKQFRCNVCFLNTCHICLKMRHEEEKTENRKVCMKHLCHKNREEKTFVIISLNTLAYLNNPDFESFTLLSLIPHHWIGWILHPLCHRLRRRMKLCVLLC